MIRRREGGYTIVEVLIVLTVSSALFSMVAFSFSGKQAKNESTQSARDLESLIQSTVNNVFNANYPSGLRCVLGVGGAPSLTVDASVKPGSTRGCIFIGKIISFGNSSAQVASVIGRQYQNGTTADIENIAQSMARVVTVAGVDTYDYPYSMTVSKVETAGATPVQLGNLAFIYELGGASSSNNPLSGSRTVNVYRAGGTVASPLAFGSVTQANFALASEGVRICLVAGNGEVNELLVGGNNNANDTFINMNVGETNACRS